MIDRNHKLSLVRQAKELAISRGSVYYQPKPVNEANLALMRTIDKLHLDYPFAGSRMLRDLLNLRGIRVGRRRVGRLMRLMGIDRNLGHPKIIPAQSNAPNANSAQFAPHTQALPIAAL